MLKLGLRENVWGQESWKKLSLTGKPVAMPKLTGDEHVIACYNKNVGMESVTVCESLEDMQHEYEQYYWGWYTDISWYIGDRAFTISAG